jgi:type II restriction enzyme
MMLDLPIEVAQGYKSQSQIARVVTEAWMGRNMYCPACSSNKLCDTTPGTEAVDFVCSRCDAPFQLKALSKPIGRKVVDAGYDAMMRAIQRNGLPHFLFMSYNYSDRKVNDLLLVPRFCLPSSAIEKRNPLAATARRAGWVGCNILLDLVPPEGRIAIISSGSIVPKPIVRKCFYQITPLADLSVKRRGWTLDVLTALRSLDKREFTIDDAYSFEALLSRMHPENRNVRPKIRQQLQILRDLGYLDFVGMGVYRWIRNNL